MSRSIHQTRRSVFKQTSKREVDQMIADGDHDVERLIIKKMIKRGILDKQCRRRYDAQADGVTPGDGSRRQNVDEGGSPPAAPDPRRSEPI